MTTTAVTGATGHLGRLVIDELQRAGTEPATIVAISRHPDRAAKLADRGVVVRAADYSDPASLPAALAGVDVLLLVSGSEVGRRVAQHTAVIETAVATGVGRVVYTSAPRADDTDLSLAVEHRGTEQVLAAAGVPYTLLRNNWYLENHTARLGEYLAQGFILGAAGDGRIGAAARADLAAAAAVVLTSDGHDNATYELGGPPFTLTELAATITEVTGTPVTYRDVSEAELIATLGQAGLDEATAAFVAGIDTSIRHGALDLDTGDLARLLGRPAVTLADAVRAAQV
ncbi:SDR family oxidoreductase [Frankia sp. AgB32]|uniref:SDR family oxidoreductase n=1 Tax=Frankia sp. AgB32 TaxID=631119 RepID=UPI002010BD1B|nr:SDR family oxidoreductase [Frankia sp. AgB32]MCK9893229.1 SDR family oxidoreductase [Frankia sp. AgB32]